MEFIAITCQNNGKSRQKPTKSFTLLKRSPHRRTGGAVTVTNAASVFNGAGLHHVVAADLLQHACRTTAVHNVLPEDKLQTLHERKGKLECAAAPTWSS